MISEKKAKTICMIAQASYPGDPRVRRQAEALEKEGYEVDILCRYSGTPLKQDKVEKFGNVTAYRLMHIPKHDKILNWFLSSSVFFVLAFFKLQILHFKRQYSVIQIHNMPDHLVFTAVIQKLFGVPVVLDIHDLTYELFNEKWEHHQHPFLLRAIRLTEWLACKFADKVITVTNTCKTRLISRGTPAEKITLVLNTPNEEVFNFDSNREFIKIEKNLRLVYHGTIDERFGLHIAIEALAIISKKIPGSIFNIYGSYSNNYGQYLKIIIRDLNLSESVILNGLLAREEIPEVLRNSDLGIVPYKQSDYMNLALPTKAFEYVAAGLPVVSTELKDLSETLNQDCITYVKTAEPAEFAETIFNLCQNPELRKNKVYNAIKRLSSISGSVMKERYVQLIKDLPGKH